MKQTDANWDKPSKKLTQTNRQTRTNWQKLRQTEPNWAKLIQTKRNWTNENEKYNTNTKTARQTRKSVSAATDYANSFVFGGFAIFVSFPMLRFNVYFFGSCFWPPMSCLCFSVDVLNTKNIFFTFYFLLCSTSILSVPIFVLISLITKMSLLCIWFCEQHIFLCFWFLEIDSPTLY